MHVMQTEKQQWIPNGDVSDDIHQKSRSCNYKPNQCAKMKLLLEIVPLDRVAPATSVDLKCLSGAGSSAELIHFISTAFSQKQISAIF